MSVLILYETKTGFTKECAQRLQTMLPQSVVFDMDSNEYVITAYSTVIIGAPIYNGELEKQAERFFIRKKKELMQVQLGIFCAGMNTSEFNQAVQRSLPPDIFYEAQIIHCGGKINYKELSFKDKMTVRRSLGIKSDKEFTNELKIEEFIKWIKEKETL